MKWMIKGVKSRLIRLLCMLDKEEDGFIGMLLIMIMSVTIFTILSSVHIYTINHARYQSGIKEAFVMQTEIENFANIITDAYNQGRDGCTGSLCCTEDGITFEFEGTGTNCSGLKVCLESSAGKGYCLVKLEEANLSGGNSPPPPPPPTPPTPILNANAEILRDCLIEKGGGVGTCHHNSGYGASKCNRNDSIKSLCQDVIKKSAQNSADMGDISLDDAIQKCCNTYQLKTINCNDPSNRPTVGTNPCLGYDKNPSSLSDPKQQMFCEICEIPVSGQKRLFTYYVCPAVITPGTPPTFNPTDCVTKINHSDPNKKAESGVFYQTFRLLEH